MTIPVEELKAAVQGFVAAAWPDVISPMQFERDAGRLLLDKAASPVAAVVWGDVRGDAPWAPTAATFNFAMSVYYLLQTESPGAQEATLQAKAGGLLEAAIAAGNRWSGVTDMHSWRLLLIDTDGSPAWRASGWAAVRVAVEVQFDYER